jgi:glutamate synthase (NADPH/NADH) small chain
MTTREDLDAAAIELLKSLGGRTLAPRDRMAIPPQEMPAQDPQERRHNMREVALGYSEAQAVVEAKRCLQCKNAPCVQGCPVKIRIPSSWEPSPNRDFAGAIGVIRENSLLPAVCGRVCPQERQCQAVLHPRQSAQGSAPRPSPSGAWSATRPTSSASPARYRCPTSPPQPAARGGGRQRVRLDHRCRGRAPRRARGDALRGLHKPGGVLVYGIPGVPPAKGDRQNEIDALVAMGVTLEPNFVVGRTRRLTGPAGPRRLRRRLRRHRRRPSQVHGYRGREFGRRLLGQRIPDPLESAARLRHRARPHADYVSKKWRCSAAATWRWTPRAWPCVSAPRRCLVYRRTADEMPARAEEIAHARRRASSSCCSERQAHPGRRAGARDARWSACATSWANPTPPAAAARGASRAASSLLEVDTVIVAIGNELQPAHPAKPRRDSPPTVTDASSSTSNGMTSLDRVYAGGDIVLGAATVILAMGEGRRAAAGINALLAERGRR